MSLAGVFTGLFLLLSCVHQTTYHLPDTTLYEYTANKPRLKTDAQFISIAYTDLFGRAIPPMELEQIKNIFLSQGDVTLNYDGYISYLLERADSLLPPDSLMRADIESFTERLYLALLNRRPGQYEIFNMATVIRNNPDIKVRDVYFALMTSEEYKRY
ncbi:MAG: hypothetical protein KatS3mg031_2012 [Chitinophagales bacterium]|nr:MAG: hypothetical protein KatS3mg031_2012 [Chitinophagales bacterium]